MEREAPFFSESRCGSLWGRFCIAKHPLVLLRRRDVVIVFGDGNGPENDPKSNGKLPKSIQKPPEVWMGLRFGSLWGPFLSCVLGRLGPSCVPRGAVVEASWLRLAAPWFFWISKASKGLMELFKPVETLEPMDIHGFQGSLEI